MSSRLISVSLLVAVMVLGGCAGHMRNPPPLAVRQSIELNFAGQEAFDDGDNDGAFARYEDAMRLSRSIEDAEGIAVNLINMAIILKDSGKQQRAVAKLDEILKNDLIEFPSGLVAEAAYIKARIYLDYSSDRKAAEELAQRAREECEGCEAEGRIFNLTGRIAYVQGQYNTAFYWGQKGLSSSRRDNNEREAANAVRIMADSKLAIKEYDEALELFGQALEADKRLAHSRKIMRDLMGMGYSLEGLKQNDKALTFFRRAIVIASYSKDDKTLSDASKAINRMLGMQ